MKSRLGYRNTEEKNKNEKLKKKKKKKNILTITYTYTDAHKLQYTVLALFIEIFPPKIYAAVRDCDRIFSVHFSVGCPPTFFFRSFGSFKHDSISLD